MSIIGPMAEQADPILDAAGLCRTSDLKSSNQAYQGHRLLLDSRALGWSAIELQVYERSCGDAYDFKTEQSERQTILVAIEGCQHVEKVDGKLSAQAPLRPGAVGLTPPGQVDRLRYRSDGKLKFVRLAISESLFIEAARLHRGRFSRRSDPTLNALAFEDPMVFRTSLALIEGLNSGASELFAESAAAWLACYLLHRASSTPLNVPLLSETVVNERRVRRAIDMMKARLAEDVRLDDIALQAAVSKFHLTRLFKQSVGTTPYAYLTGLRLEAARKMLSSSELPVKAIAPLCGYDHQTKFSTAFKQRYGCSPTEWRKRVLT